MNRRDVFSVGSKRNLMSKHLLLGDGVLEPTSLEAGKMCRLQHV